MSCDLLKSHKLIENRGDDKKRKEMILTILGREDLLSMLNGHDRSRSQRQQTQQDIPAEKMY